MAANRDILLGYAEQAEWTMTPDSSNVAAVGHAKGFPYVFVEFKGGGKRSMYAYHTPGGIAAALARGIAASPSKGKAVNALLKSQFGYDRLY
jgi:hypothetical protein